MDRYPLRVEANRDESLSRWLWLVKWILLVPHYVALLVLWTGLVVLTVVAYLAVLFTGRYPAPIRAYNLGVLRWNWRVGYYGYAVLGTDAYPPFTLAEVPGYPARLTLEPSGPPPRWLPLVAWLLALPHVMLLGALYGAAGGTGDAPPASLPLIALLIAAVALLFTGRYPAGLHDLLVGAARWNLRVLAYLTLLVPVYPPFRLDQGGREPHPDPGPDTAPAPPHPGTSPSPGPVIALIVGVLMLAPAAGMTVGGGTLLAVDVTRDQAGYVSSPLTRLTSTTAAVTAEHLTIADTRLWVRETTGIGALRVTVDAPDGRAVFVGLAPQPEVDAWLAGTAHDQLVGMGSGRPLYERAAGSGRAVAAPEAQGFWLARATGQGTVTLRWTAADGEYAVVVANADGSPGVAADVRGAVSVPDLTGLGAGLLATGLALGLAAVALVIAGGTGLGRHHAGPRISPASAGAHHGEHRSMTPPVPRQRG